MNTRTPGAKIAHYGRSRSMTVVFSFLALLFIGVGGFLLWGLVPKVGKTINFDGDISILYNTAYGALGIGILIFLFMLFILKPGTQFTLYENAIRTTGKNGERTDYYEDIEDLFIFFWGGFGYRKTSTDSWVFAGGKTSGIGTLTNRLQKLHAKHRGDKLYKELKAGKTVVFHYFSDQDALSKSFVATRNLDYTTYTLELTEQTIKIQNKTIAIKQLKDISTNLWTEKLKLLDIEGNVFHEMHISALMSAHIFETLLCILQTE